MSKLTEDELRLDICADEKGLRWVMASDARSGVQCKISGNYSISEAKDRAIRIINEEIADAAQKGLQQEVDQSEHRDRAQSGEKPQASCGDSIQCSAEGEKAGREA